jgi:hypothetical protein
LHIGPFDTTDDDAEERLGPEEHGPLYCNVAGGSKELRSYFKPSGFVRGLQCAAIHQLGLSSRIW